MNWSKPGSFRSEWGSRAVDVRVVSIGRCRQSCRAVIAEEFLKEL